MSTVGVWRITATQNLALNTGDSTLDEVTRQLPDGYYSTFRTFDQGTRILGLTSHLRRLYEPVRAPDVDASFLRRQLRVLLEAYRPGEARVRAVMTQAGQAYLAVAPLAPLPPEVYEIGVRVETAELQREHPQLKSTSFIGRSDAERKHIAEEGIYEALLVKGGKILEGMTSNFFYIKHKGSSSVGRPALSTTHSSPGGFRKREVVLCTAPDDILLGITRATVIEIARNRGLDVKYQPLGLDQLDSVKEAFITSSSRGVVPVIQIDSARIGQGSPGPVTKELSAAYAKYVIQKAEAI